MHHLVGCRVIGLFVCADVEVIVSVTDCEHEKASSRGLPVDEDAHVDVYASMKMHAC